MITDDHLGELNDIINKAREQVEYLNDFEIIFLQEWEFRLNNKGQNVVVSDKQSFIFEAIYRKLSQLCSPIDLRDYVNDCQGNIEKVDLL